MREDLAVLNPSFPVSALDDSFHRLTYTEGATLEARNFSFNRMPVNGMTVEYRSNGGTIQGEQARVTDFDNPSNNNWLVVNQFTVTENRDTRRPDPVLFVNGLPLGIIEPKSQPQ